MQNLKNDLKMTQSHQHPFNKYYKIQLSTNIFALLFFLICVT